MYLVFLLGQSFLISKYMIYLFISSEYMYDCYNQFYEYVFSLYFRECQDSNNQKAMSLYVAINLKKEKKERRRRKILGCSLLEYKTITSFHQTVLCFISSFKSIMRFQKNF